MATLVERQKQSAEIARKARALYTKGHSIRKIADALGVSYGVIYRRLEADPNVKLRKRGGQTKVK